MSNEDEPKVEVVSQPTATTIPPFVREAVNRLENPNQARLLLKILRMHGSLGMLMSPTALNKIVDRILANKELASPIRGSEEFEPVDVVVTIRDASGVLESEPMQFTYEKLKKP